MLVDCLLIACGLRVDGVLHDCCLLVECLLFVELGGFRNKKKLHSEE